MDVASVITFLNERSWTAHGIVHKWYRSQKVFNQRLRHHATWCLRRRHVSGHHQILIYLYRVVEKTQKKAQGTVNDTTKWRKISLPGSSTSCFPAKLNSFTDRLLSRWTTSDGVRSIRNMLSVLFSSQHCFDLDSSDTTPANLNIRTLGSGTKSTVKQQSPLCPRRETHNDMTQNVAQRDDAKKLAFGLFPCYPLFLGLVLLGFATFDHNQSVDSAHLDERKHSGKRVFRMARDDAEGSLRALSQCLCDREVKSVIGT